MTPATEQTTIRHIVVTLDASETGRPALETAVHLAAILGAELEGIFVEDINLMRVAELPFLREVRLWSLAEETFSAQRMQHELRTLARQAERMLEQAAMEMGVPWSFQVWRGSAGAEILAETFAADILSLERVSALSFSRLRALTRPRARLSRRTITSICVLYSDSEQAVRALTTACNLAKDMGAPLSVLLPEDLALDTADLEKKGRAILDPYGQTARFVQLGGSDVQTLMQTAVGVSGSCLLIAEAGHPLLRSVGLDRCLDALACPVLLVR